MSVLDLFPRPAHFFFSFSNLKKKRNFSGVFGPKLASCFSECQRRRNHSLSAWWHLCVFAAVQSPWTVESTYFIRPVLFVCLSLFFYFFIFLLCRNTNHLNSSIMELIFVLFQTWSLPIQQPTSLFGTVASTHARGRIRVVLDAPFQAVHGHRTVVCTH